MIKDVTILVFYDTIYFLCCLCFFFFKQKTAYERRISDWSSDVCSSDLTGAPLAAPSANASGRVSPTKAEHVLASLDGRIALVIDDGPTSAGVESTIARVRDGAVEILRPGPVTADMLGAASGLAARGVEGSEVVAPGVLASHYAPGKAVGRGGGGVVRGGGGGARRWGWDGAIGREGGGAVGVWGRGPVTADMLGGASGLAARGVEGSEVVAPGMLASHYAPGKPVRLGAATFADDEFGIGFGAVAGDYDLSAAGDLTEAAAGLFDALHAGAASAKTKIAAEIGRAHV